MLRSAAQVMPQEYLTPSPYTVDGATRMLSTPHYARQQAVRRVSCIVRWISSSEDSQLVKIFLGLGGASGDHRPDNNCAVLGPLSQ